MGERRRRLWGGGGGGRKCINVCTHRESSRVSHATREWDKGVGGMGDC